MEPQQDVAIEISPEAAQAMARLLELGLVVEAFEALAAALQRQTEAGLAGRASLHVDTPPGSGPAGAVVKGAGNEPARPFLCRGRR